MNAHRSLAKAISPRRGQAIVVVLMICLILGILAGAIMNFQRGQIHLLSKGAKDFLARCVAEAGVHCVLGEMRADYQFVTHGNAYIPKDGWAGPSNNRFLHLKGVTGLHLDQQAKGTYTGRVSMRETNVVGHFKVRVKLQKSKNSVDTKTVDEAHRYFLLEAFGRVGDACRKVTVVLEKHVPGSYQFYDGQILDLGGFGPYRITPGILRQGRLYGHEQLVISQRGPFDAGFELLDMEKISTPGHLEVENSTHVEFRGGKKGRLKGDTDSTFPDKFATFPEAKGGKTLGHFVLDGLQGGKPEKFPHLNPQYYLQARDPKPKILDAGTGFDGFSESRWRNPAKPAEVVYDLNFGWKYESRDQKVLLYSKVPLRVWGCPPNKATTIFCEKDVYIAGDFNANPDNPQNYDLGYREYTDTPENGTDKNGAMILSLGRIWFDYSNPMLFLRNEIMTVLDYDLAMCLGGEEVNAAVMAGVVYPPRFSTNASDKRLPMTGLNFSAISTLFSLPKTPPEVIPMTVAALPMHPAMDKWQEYLKPTQVEEEYRKRFCIKSFMKREAAVAKVAGACYTIGMLTKGMRDQVILAIFDEAEKEIAEDEPDRSLGPWNIADRAFKLAVTHPKMGFRFPEMTVNALLIDSAELNARWSTGNSTNKVLPEIGNIESKEARCFPFIGKDSRMIIRHMGGRLHLRNRPANPFLTGAARDDFSIVRRNVYDRTFAAGGGDYFPAYPPAAFSIINWTDQTCPVSEFEAVD